MRSTHSLFANRNCFIYPQIRRRSVAMYWSHVWMDSWTVEVSAASCQIQMDAFLSSSPGLSPIISSIWHRLWRLISHVLYERWMGFAASVFCEGKELEDSHVSLLSVFHQAVAVAWFSRAWRSWCKSNKVLYAKQFRSVCYVPRVMRSRGLSARI